MALPTPSTIFAASRTRRLLYAAVAAGLILLANFYGILPVFRSHLQRYLAIGDSRFGLLFSIPSIAGLVGGFVGGIFIDRWGPRRSMRCCLIGLGAALLIVALAGPRYGWFVAAAVVTGLFRRPMETAVNLYLARLFRRHQRRAISMNLVSAGVGAMLFPVIAEGLLVLSARSDSISFADVLHGPFLLVGAFLLIASFLYQKPPRSPLAPAVQKRPQWRWRNLHLPPRLMLLACLIGLHGACDSTLHIWMARFLESRSFDEVLIRPGIVLAGFAVAYIASRFTLIVLPERIGQRLFLFAPGLAGGATIVLAILSRSFLLTSVGYVLGAFLWSWELPTFVTTAIRSEGRRFGTVMAVASVVGGLCMFALVNGVGILSDVLGEERLWLAMLVPAAGFVVVGLGGLTWVVEFGATGRENRREESESTNGEGNGNPT